MSSNKPPRALSLSELQDRCTQETNNFRHGQDEEAWHCYEIFRRAVVEKSEEAWELIVGQYQNQVKGWVEHYPRFRDFQETTEFFVNQVFEKFWRRNFSAVEFARFPNLKALLAYLKTCVGSVMTDYWRVQKRKADMVYLDDLSPQHIQVHVFSYYDKVQNHLEQKDFWNDLRIQMDDEQAFKVLYASFVLNLKPIDIYNELPNSYNDVQEIYKIKAKAISRLSHVLQVMGLLSNFPDQSE